MDKRLKELRKNLKLTQQEFSNRIGIKRNNIACYETGKNTPSDAAISLICREFNVNENWLRTGEGEMFLSSNRTSEIRKLTNQLLSEESDSFKNRFINMLANLTVEEWAFLEKMALKLVEPSIISDNNGQMTYNFNNNKNADKNESINKPVEELEVEYKKSRLHSVRNINSSASNTTDDIESKKNVANK